MDWRLKQGYVIPAGTAFARIDGTKRKYVEGNYEALIANSKDSTVSVVITDDVGNDRPELFERASSGLSKAQQMAVNFRQQDRLRAQKETIIRICEDDGSYYASSPSYPGLFVDGDTLEEVLDGLKDGVSAYGESLKKHGE